MNSDIRTFGTGDLIYHKAHGFGIVRFSPKVGAKNLFVEFLMDRLQGGTFPRIVLTEEVAIYASKHLVRPVQKQDTAMCPRCTGTGLLPSVSAGVPDPQSWSCSACGWPGLKVLVLSNTPAGKRRPWSCQHLELLALRRGGYICNAGGVIKCGRILDALPRDGLHHTIRGLDGKLSVDPGVDLSEPDMASPIPLKPGIRTQTLPPLQSSAALARGRAKSKGGLV